MYAVSSWPFCIARRSGCDGKKGTRLGEGGCSTIGGDSLMLNNGDRSLDKNMCWSVWSLGSLVIRTVEEENTHWSTSKADQIRVCLADLGFRQIRILRHEERPNPRRGPGAGRREESSTGQRLANEQSKAKWSRVGRVKQTVDKGEYCGRDLWECSTGWVGDEEEGEGGKHGDVCCEMAGAACLRLCCVQKKREARHGGTSHPARGSWRRLFN